MTLDELKLLYKVINFNPVKPEDLLGANMIINREIRLKTMNANLSAETDESGRKS